MRRICSIFLYVVAGFFLYTMTVIAFAHPDEEIWIKWVVMGVFLACSFLAMCLGLVVQSFQRWRRELGFTLLSTSGFCAFAFLGFACFFLDEEFRAMVNPQFHALFNDYATGSAVTVLLAAIGWFLLRADKDRNRASETMVTPPTTPAS